MQAVFDSYGGMEGLPFPIASPRGFGFLGHASLVATHRGALAAGTIALAASWLSQHYNVPIMLFALLLGMTFNFLHDDRRCEPGIEFSSRTVLRVGVALLGARITLAQILGLGVVPIVTVAIGVISTILFGVIVARWMGLGRTFGLLSGSAVGICGASAALAVASILPKSADRERDAILTVVVVTALSTIAMILYPLMARVLGLDNANTGIFLGGAIHDVAQVVGAGYTISPETGDIATYVKLLRVALLLPIVFSIAFFINGSWGERRRTAPPLPLFLLGFAFLVVVNSLGFLPKLAVNAANDISHWCLATAIAALGMKTSFAAMAAAGWRPVLLMILETIWIAAVVLIAVACLR